MKGNAGAIGLYGFGVLLLYLAGMYFGSYLLFLFLVSLAYPALSLLLTGVAVRRFRFGQSWDREAPLKGQESTWTLTLVNGSLLPLYQVEARFRVASPLPTAEVSNFRFFLKPREQLRYSAAVRFPFRGTYTAGLEAVQIKDFLQLFSFRLPAQPTSFTVYPAIHKLQGFSTAAGNGEGSPASRLRELLPDFTQFSHLREYRPGESLKHVSWKKFASLGIPLIRDYDTTVDDSVRIYLDLRLPLPLQNGAMSPAEQLTLEDTSIELLVALVHDFLNRGIPTSVTVPGSEPTRYFGTRPEHFRDLYAATLGMSFHDSLSAGRIHQAEAGEGGTTIFITHLADGETRAVLKRAAASKQKVYLIYNRVVSPASSEKGSPPGSGCAACRRSEGCGGEQPAGDPGHFFEVRSFEQQPIATAAASQTLGRGSCSRRERTPQDAESSRLWFWPCCRPWFSSWFCARNSRWAFSFPLCLPSSPWGSAGGSSATTGG